MRRCTRNSLGGSNNQGENESGKRDQVRCNCAAYAALTVLLLIVTTNFIHQVIARKLLGFTTPGTLEQLQVAVESVSTMEVELESGVGANARCQSGYVYVYTLPKRMNYDLLQQCQGLKCELWSHNGLGELAFPNPTEKEMANLTRLFVDPTLWFKSRDFEIDITYHARLLQHPCRTDDPAKAAIFFLPFYTNVALRSVMKLRNETVSNALPDKFVAWLEKQPYFKRKGGHDHFLVLGHNAYHHMSSEGDPWGSHLLKRRAMENVTKLASFRAPWERTQMGVPYLTFFHPSTDAQIRAWQQHVRNAQRKWRASFIGSKKRAEGAYQHSKASFEFRVKLMQQCQEWDDCGVLDCQDMGMGQKSVCHSPAPPLEMQITSDFCLQPSGDDPVRKSTFDSIVAGCIPVFFCKNSAYYQYLWHLPAEWESYSVFIEQKEMEAGNVTLKEVLSAYSRDKIQKMQQRIIDEVLPQIIVANPENYKLVEFQDAVDRTVEGMMTKVALLRAGLKHSFPNPWDMEHLPMDQAYSPLRMPLGTA